MENKQILTEEEMKMLTVLIPKSLHTNIKVEASKRGEKLKEYVARILEEALDKAEAEEGNA